MRSSTQPFKLVSVITVVRNAEATIGATIASVIALKGADVEYIVFDGNSTDKTADVIRAFGTDIDRFVSARDEGAYDAMNKAISLASGQFVIHINDGDKLTRIPREELLAAPAEAALVVFPVVEGNGCFVSRNNWRIRFKNTIHHQGAFYRRHLMPPYNIKYRTFADFDLNQRLHKTRPIVCLPGAVAEHAPGGMSYNPEAFSEIREVILGNYGLLFFFAQPVYIELGRLWWKGRAALARWGSR